MSRNSSRKRTSVIWKIDKQELQKIVSGCNSFADIMRHFDLVATGGWYRTLRKRFVEDGIDYAHIHTGLGSNKGRKFIVNAIPLSDILVEHSSYSRGHLKQRLIKEGLLDNKCQICEQEPFWNWKPLKFVLDHINGVRDDHRIENLRLLCPNCNSQTDTFCGKNVVKNYHRCKKCGKKNCKKSEYCYDCYRSLPERQKVVRPSKEELEEMLWGTPTAVIAKQYGVVDNTIGKWAKAYGIKKPPRGYWQKQEAEQRRKQGIGMAMCECCNNEFKIVYTNQKYCSQECYKLARINPYMPTRERLDRMVWEMPINEIARAIGVNTSAVIWWCKSYGISKPPRGYWGKITLAT